MTTARSDNRGRPWVINHFKGDVAMNVGRDMPRYHAECCD